MPKTPHPSVQLRERIPEGMTITDLAKHLGVDRVSLSMLLNERRGVSTEMALRLARAFETSPRYWLELQLDYDLANQAPPPHEIKPLPLGATAQG